jgi:hypothetical protein
MLRTGRLLNVGQVQMGGVGGDDQEVGPGAQAAGGVEEAGIEPAGHQGVALLIDEDRCAAVIVDDHRGVAKVAALGDEALGDGMEALLEIHGGLRADAT